MARGVCGFRGVVVLAAIAAMLGLAGCGDRTDGGKAGPKAATQESGSADKATTSAVTAAKTTPKPERKAVAAAALEPLTDEASVPEPRLVINGRVTTSDGGAGKQRDGQARADCGSERGACPRRQSAWR